MKAADIVKKKGQTDDKGKKPVKGKSSALVDWISKRRTVTTKAQKKEADDGED